MEEIYKIDWEMIITEIILPHFSTIIIYTLSFCSIGLILALIYIMILKKNQVFVRQHKYYNWFVKLYIPLLVIVFLYFSLNFALIYSAKSIVKKEEPKVVNEIYDATINQIFQTPEARKDFILQLKEKTRDLTDTQEIFVDEAEETISRTFNNYSLVNSDNKKITNYFISKYKDNLYNAILFGLNVATGSKMKPAEMTYKEINSLVNVLNTLEPAKIETSVKSKLTDMVDKIITSQINGFAKTTLLIFLLLIFIPVLEWFIYNWYVKRKIKTSIKSE